MHNSLMTHPVETHLVVLYPVDWKGQRIPMRQVTGTGKNKKETDSPISFILVDGERIAVSPGGTLIEKWKADFVLESHAHRHIHTDEVLDKMGISPHSPEYKQLLGATMEQSRYEMREPSREEILSVTVPIDEVEFNRVAKMSPEFEALAQRHETALKAAIRANPDVDVERLFQAFSLAFDTTKKTTE